MALAFSLVDIVEVHFRRELGRDLVERKGLLKVALSVEGASEAVIGLAEVLVNYAVSGLKAFEDLVVPDCPR